MIPEHHPLASILSNDDISQISCALEKLNTQFFQGTTNQVHPLELLGGFLSNVDIFSLKEENVRLKNDKLLLSNRIENIIGEKECFISIHSDCKKLPKEIAFLTGGQSESEHSGVGSTGSAQSELPNALNIIDISALQALDFTPLKEARVIPMKLNWNQSNVNLAQEEFTVDFSWRGCKSKCEFLQVYNPSKDRMLVLTFKYDTNDVQSIDVLYIITYQKGKLKSIEVGKRDNPQST